MCHWQCTVSIMMFARDVDILLEMCVWMTQSTVVLAMLVVCEAVHWCVFLMKVRSIVFDLVVVFEQCGCLDSILTGCSGKHARPGEFEKMYILNPPLDNQTLLECHGFTQRGAHTHTLIMCLVCVRIFYFIRGGKDWRRISLHFLLCVCFFLECETKRGSRGFFFGITRRTNVFFFYE